MIDKSQLKQSVKDYRMLKYDNIRRLVRRENVLKYLEGMSFYGVELDTTCKVAKFVIEFPSLNTHRFDALAKALRANFDDYVAHSGKKFIRIEAEYYYGD